MELKEINIWEGNVPDADLFSTVGDVNNEGLPTLTPYLLEGDEPRSAIIVCPGGSFQFRASGEGEPIARWLNRIGISAFVLNYRVAPFSPFTSTKDAVRAVRYVRYHAREFNIDPERIGMMGFSAGGYLAAFVGTRFDNGLVELGSRDAQIMSMLLGEPDIDDPVDQTSARLDALVLCYAETSPFARDRLPPDSLLTRDVTVDDFIDFTANHKHVSTRTPPTFLWITATDHWNFQSQNLLFAQALNELNLPFDLHIFSKGPHGLGLAEGEPTVAVWTELCEVWLQGLNFPGLGGVRGG